MPFIVNLLDFKIEFRISEETFKNQAALEGLPERIEGYDIFQDVESVLQYSQKEIGQMSRTYLHTKGIRARVPAETAKKLLAVWEADESIELFPKVNVGKLPKDHPNHGNRKRDCYLDLKEYLIAIYRNLRLWENRDSLSERFGAKHDLAPDTVKVLYTEIRQDNPILLKIPNRPNLIYKAIADDNRRRNKTREFCIIDLCKSFGLSRESAEKVIDGKKI